MPAPRLKSYRFRKLQRRVPGGATKQHYLLRKPKIAHCAECKAKLIGIPRLEPRKIKKMGKSKKRPERPFGGILCSRCQRRRIIQKHRV